MSLHYVVAYFMSFRMEFGDCIDLKEIHMTIYINTEIGAGEIYLRYNLK